ncbi:hypothetical protein CWE22_08920 [Pseudidiomarina aestuarii]|uniref:Solute-binding protein family 3/N-terminal domain-containing protein n=1 Tax=Pseudidiomarina aestuarii TaxID=624146 RepID=A0A7Z7ESV9_9GAMM|nr:transporter substrate-binding domain-containing protein [Pseudidiomarina aestuarii]RUO39414.1 hypothetical protein CWE22_08920 [Pseudidiomarina aestuarii]
MSYFARLLVLIIGVISASLWFASVLPAHAQVPFVPLKNEAERPPFPIQESPLVDQGRVPPVRDVVFRRPENGPFTDYVRELVEKAYANLGIRVGYVDMPRTRSLVEANSGRIAGELGRLPGLESEFNNLIPVPFPLFSFEIVLIADRRKCGICNLEQVDSIAYISGMQSVEAILKDYQYTQATATAQDLDQLHLMFENERVEGVLMNDFEARQLGYYEDRHRIVVPLWQNQAFHYLHKSYQHLVPLLAAEFNRLQLDGEIDRISRRNSVTPFATSLPAEQALSFESVSATSGYWRTYTDLDGTGKYWDIIRRVFEPITADLNINTNTYLRAIFGLSDQRFDMLVGTYAHHQPRNAIVSRLHFDYDRPLYVFTLTEADMEQVRSGTLEKPICHVAGYQYGEFLPEGLNYYFANSSLDCFAMLDEKRAGAVINYRENLPDWNNTPYERLLIHNSLPIHVAFQDTPRGRALRDYFDRRFRELVSSGEIAEIYNERELERSKLGLSIRPQTAVAATPQN